MIIIIVGSGGRENILAEKLNNGINKLYCIGESINPDICKNVKSYMVVSPLNNYQLLLDYCDIIKPDLIVIGPEIVLNTPFVNECKKKFYYCIGPCKELAQLETSKIFTRNLLTDIHENKYNPHFILIDKKNYNNQILDFTKKYNTDYVIKLDGLAGGKGVFVQGDHFQTIQEGLEIINNKITNEDIVIEEKLIGEEFSLFTLSDGDNFIHLPPVQDYKRAYDYNKGPNTGGMGSIMNDFDFISNDDIKNCENLNERVLKKMKSKFWKPYVGVLYGSYMKTKNGNIKLIEYNCRFGDSEVFNILNCIDTDLSKVFKSMTEGTLGITDVKINKKTSVVKYLVPQGYPNNPIKKKINYHKIDNVYASSLNDSNYLLGSRSIAVYAEGKNINEAYEKCENLIKIVNKDELYWRKDIGRKSLTYKSSGVDVDEGNKFVNLIKKDVESTYNSNVLGKHGNFGGQFKYKNDVLVASTDGVGTKGVLIKKFTDSYYVCGHDIVNHSINDILVQGAFPLFFLDYVASSKLNIIDTASFVKGCCDACKKFNCVLLGGETAEMPSIYKDNHMDMVGTIVGEKKINIVDITKNDIAIGYSSSGPHTNGYTLIRKILQYNNAPQDILNKLLEPHTPYLNEIIELCNNYYISGMCHITGGGLTENLKRTIPENLHLDLSCIQYPDWCVWLKNKGNISDEEMKKTFNCGIGFITFIKPLIRDKPLKIGIMGSTKCSVMDYIVNAINDETSLIYNKVNIVKVISNKKNSGILERCDGHGINNKYMKISSSKEEYYQSVTTEFENDDVELILCIGWMSILPPSFVNKWKNKCINVHPSLLPKYAGGMDMNVHEEVLKNNELETGCTVHIMTEEVDKGAVIVQKKCDVKNNDTPEILKKRVQYLEGLSLIETLYYGYNNLLNDIDNNKKILGYLKY